MALRVESNKWNGVGGNTFWESDGWEEDPTTYGPAYRRLDAVGETYTPPQPGDIVRVVFWRGYEQFETDVVVTGVTHRVEGASIVTARS